MRYRVDVTGGALTVVVGYPVISEGEPSSDGAPFLSGMSLRRIGSIRFHRGDVDQNDSWELTDAIQILGYLFLGSTTMVPLCEDAADVDDNGAIEMTDAIRFLCWFFLMGCPIPLPGSPERPCGPDPTTDDLGCASYDPANCQ